MGSLFLTIWPKRIIISGTSYQKMVNMYDKIKFFIPRTRLAQDVTPYLEKVCNVVDAKTGECIQVSGTTGGIKVSMFPGGISVIGSLPKYYNQSNVFTLDRSKTEEALQMLSDALHIDMMEAFVTGLEFGTQFPMKKPPGAYFRLFGDIPRLRKETVGTTVYYKSPGKRQNKTLCFYDKTEEATTKGIATPGILSGMPLLRYEARFNGHLAKQFKVQEVTGATLVEKAFYKNMVRIWQENYFAIPKMNGTKYNDMDNIKTAKDAVNVFFARLISQTGADEIGEFVTELRQNGTFSDAKYYTRVKKQLHDIASSISEQHTNEDIRELDDAIKNAGEYL